MLHDLCVSSSLEKMHSWTFSAVLETDHFRVVHQKMCLCTSTATRSLNTILWHHWSSRKPLSLMQPVALFMTLGISISTFVMTSSAPKHFCRSGSFPAGTSMDPNDMNHPRMHMVSENGNTQKMPWKYRKMMMKQWITRNTQGCTFVSEKPIWTIQFFHETSDELSNKWQWICLMHSQKLSSHPRPLGGAWDWYLGLSTSRSRKFGQKPWLRYHVGGCVPQGVSHV